MSKKVLITGMGMISSVGSNVEEAYNALVQGRVGTKTAKYLATTHKDNIPVSEVGFSDQELAEMAGFDPAKPVTRTTCLGLIAAREAALSAGLFNLSRLRSGFISATTVGGMGKTENNYLEYLKDDCSPETARFIDLHECGQSTLTIANALGFNDYTTTVSTACSSSANAVMLAARLIKNNILDRVIVGGVDALTRFTLNGFNTLMILDRDLCRPFDDSRQGLNLGEGAGFIVVESEKAAEEGGREVLGELKGYSNTNDAYHQTALSPEGHGAYLAMKNAVTMAGLSPGQIDYINVHGTGTPNNDLSEARAMERLFGAHVPRFSSTKTYTGHTLGAAGGIEAVIALLTIKNQTIFPNHNFRTPMKETACRPVTTIELKAGVKNVLSNSFGFGGNNAALVFSAV